MEITGLIEQIILNAGTEAFAKSILVIKTEEQHTQYISIDFVATRADLVEPYEIGERVKVSINLGGRAWVNPQGETKYFNSISGWKIARPTA